MDIQDVVIEPQFEKFLELPTDDEIRKLAEDVKLHGFREPIVVWLNHSVLLDGHRRYRVWRRLCEELGEDAPEPEIVEYKFGGEDEAKAWMAKNQLMRRNLSPKRQSELRGLYYVSEKKTHGGNRKNTEKNRVKSKGQNDPLKSTADKVADETGVSEATVKRDAKYATAMESIEAFNGKFAADIRSGAVTLSKANVIKIGALSKADKAKALKNIRNGLPWNHKPNKPAAGKDFDPKQWEPDKKEVAAAKKAVEKAYGALVRSLDVYGDATGTKNGDNHNGLLETLGEFEADFERWAA